MSDHDTCEATKCTDPAQVVLAISGPTRSGALAPPSRRLCGAHAGEYTGRLVAMGFDPSAVIQTPATVKQ